MDINFFLKILNLCLFLQGPYKFEYYFSLSCLIDLCSFFDFGVFFYLFCSTFMISCILSFITMIYSLLLSFCCLFPLSHFLVPLCFPHWWFLIEVFLYFLFSCWYFPVLFFSSVNSLIIVNLKSLSRRLERSVCLRSFQSFCHLSLVSVNSSVSLL